MSLYCVGPNTQGQRQGALEASEPCLMAPSWTSVLHKQRSYMLFVICQQLVRWGHHMLSYACQRALCSGFVPQIELIHRDLGHTPAMGGEGTHKDEPLEGCFQRPFFCGFLSPWPGLCRWTQGGSPVFCRSARVSTQLFEADHRVITQSL